jgi:hypothetical protein
MTKIIFGQMKSLSKMTKNICVAQNQSLKKQEDFVKINMKYCFNYQQNARTGRSGHQIKGVILCQLQFQRIR